jgi:enoyl-CoA hydratase
MLASRGAAPSGYAAPLRFALMGAVELSISGRRAELELARPEVLNAMNWEMFDGLAAAADAVAEMPEVRVLLIRGRGRSFSSGIDTSAFDDLAGSFDEMVVRAQAGFRKIAALRIPVLAGIHGHALGAGLQLALACDLRVVATDATLGLIEATFGLIPDLGGSQRLPALVGPSRAKRMMWLSERIDGTEAGRIGLADLVVAPAKLTERAEELAAQLEAAPPVAVREVKRLVEMSGRVPLSAGMDEEAASQGRALASSDFAEGVSAFMQKRRARF